MPYSVLLFWGEEGDQGGLGEVGAQGPPVKYFSVLHCVIPVVTGGYHYFCSLGEDTQKYFCKIQFFHFLYKKQHLSRNTQICKVCFLEYLCKSSP